MIIIHWSRAFNYLDSSILKRVSKDHDFLWTEKEYNTLKDLLKSSWEFQKIVEKSSSREDKIFLVWFRKNWEKKIIEYTFIDKKGVTKHYKSDLDLYFKGQLEGINRDREIYNEINVKSSILSFVSLPLSILIEEKLSHITKSSKLKYKNDWNSIESYLVQNKINLENTLDQNLISKKRNETVEYRKIKKTKVIKEKKELNVNEFFDEYKIRRYIKHDNLHKYIGTFFNTWDWTFSKLVEPNGYSIKEITFNLLSKEEKFSLILEEIFVLTLERKIVPRYLERITTQWDHISTIIELEKIFEKKYFEMYKYYVLNLKWIPRYIKTYVKQNSSELISESKKKIREYNVLRRLPKEFYLEIIENHRNKKVILNNY